VTHVFEIVAGPDAGRLVGVAPGRHLVGRAAGCHLVIDDPAVESHHAVLTVGVSGGLHLAQVAGRSPVLVDGRPVGDGVVLGPGAAIEIGDSLVVRRDARAAPALRRIARAQLGCGSVVLGTGIVRIPIAGCDERDAVPHDLQAALDRIEVRHRHPIWAELARADRVVVGLTAVEGDTASLDARGGVVSSITTQLAADPVACRWVVVHAPASGWSGAVAPGVERVVLVTERAAPLVDGGPVDRLVDRGIAVTVLLLVGASSPAVGRCTSVLHVGARWRARWIADTADSADPLGAIRLHLRGARALRPAALVAA
jgi:hypothetical protein